MKIKIITIILAFALVLGCFAGCGDSSDSSSAASSSAVNSTQESPAPDSSAESTEPESYTYTTFDYESGYAAHSPDTVVLTVNGKEVTWDEYFGWIYTIVSEMEMYLGTNFVWDDMFSETHTFGSYVQFYAEAMAAQYSIIYNMGLDMGLELSEEELKVIDDAFANDAMTYAGGDPAAFEEYLESTFMSKDYYYYINTVATFYQNIYESIYGQFGENFSDEQVAQFVEDNGYLYAKHILFKTVDDAGTPYDEATVAEKKAAAESALAELRAIADTEEMMQRFDELMHELSDDTGLISYPDGYYFAPGEMVPEFENGTKALEDYAVSEIIESSYGYHIILRLPIEPDAMYDGVNSFRYMASTYDYDEVAQGWFNEAEIVYMNGFETIDFNQLLVLKEMTVSQ